MARYIDAERLLTVLNMNFAPNGALNVLDKIINEQPTADVAEVVRCKDCGVKGAAFCMAGDFPLTETTEECFCSYGERRENGRFTENAEGV